MNKSENMLRNLVALAAAASMGAVLVFALVCGYLGFVNARLREENQELRAMIARRPEQPTLPAVTNLPPIKVDISGASNVVNIASTDTGGASGDVNVYGMDGRVMVYLGAGQTAQVTSNGMSNKISIASALKGRVSCSDSGSGNTMTFSQ